MKAGILPYMAMMMATMNTVSGEVKYSGGSFSDMSRKARKHRKHRRQIANASRRMNR